MKEEFDEWLWKVCELNSNEYVDAHEVRSLTDLTEAKTAFIQGQLPNEFEL